VKSLEGGGITNELKLEGEGWSEKAINIIYFDR